MTRYRDSRLKKTMINTQTVEPKSGFIIMKGTDIMLTTLLWRGAEAEQTASRTTSALMWGEFEETVDDVRDLLGLGEFE